MPYPLLTERLSIEPLGPKDLESFLRYRQDPEIAKFQSWETCYSKNQAMELIESQVGMMLPAQGGWLQLAVHSRLAGEHLGDLALQALENDNSVFEIGFTFAKEHQGQGFAQEAASKLMEHLFTEVGANKLIAHTDRRNTSSIRLLQKLGFLQRPEKSWVEEFKNELVTVDCFEISKESN